MKNDDMKLYKILSNHKIIMKDEGWEKSTEGTKNKIRHNIAIWKRI